MLAVLPLPVLTGRGSEVLPGGNARMGQEAQSVPTLRKRVFDFLERGRRQDIAARAFGVAMVLLIIANVTATIFETVPAIAAQYGFWLTLFDRFCVLVFIAEYAARIWTAPEHPKFRLGAEAPNRLKFAMSPMMVIDLMAILPFFLELIFPQSAAVRLLRLVRFLKVARYSPAMSTIGTVIAAQRQPLVACIVLFVGLLLFAAAVMLVLEGGLHGDKLSDLPSAMWWSVTMLTKLGQTEISLQTPIGKIFAAFVMLLGIGFIALPVGIIGRGFYDEIRKRDFVVTFGMVARVPLFASLDAATIAELVDLLKARKVAAQSIIIRKGEEADAMYLIASGQVEVAVDGGSVRLGEGDFFGEMALLSHSRRTATVIARRATELLVLDADDFDRLLSRNAELAETIRGVAASRAERGGAAKVVKG